VTDIIVLSSLSHGHRSTITVPAATVRVGLVLVSDVVSESPDIESDTVTVTMALTVTPADAEPVTGRPGAAAAAVGSESAGVIGLGPGLGPGDAGRTDRDLSQWNYHTRLMYRNQLCLTTLIMLVKH
jgi:hypothetical protein